MAMSKLGKHAAALAGRGFRLIPLHVPTKGGCSCRQDDCGKSAGKHPRFRRWQRSCSSDLNKVRGWWKRWPDANIGIAMGGPGRLVALDIDGELGRSTLARLEAEHGELLQTLAIRSGREDGGEHRIFRVPDDLDIRAIPNRVGKPTSATPGIDVRAEGGQIVAPPSLHYTGRRYSWVNPATPIAELPRWLFEVITREPKLQAAERPAGPQSVPYHQRVQRAAAYLERVPGAVDGQQGGTHTFMAAQKIGRGFDLDESTTYALMRDSFNPRCEPPWTERDLRRKVSEAFNKGTMAWGELLRAGDHQPRESRPRRPYHEQPAPAPAASSVSSNPPPAPPPTKPKLSSTPPSLSFERGDHVELAQHMIASLPAQRVVYDDGGVYGYGDPAHTEGVWVPYERPLLSRQIQGFAGSPVGAPNKSGKQRELSIRAHDVNGSIRLAQDAVAEPGFFADAPPGIVFTNGFKVVTANGVESRPHHESNRARFAYDFAYKERTIAPRWLRFLDEIFQPDLDKGDKIACLQEFTGAALLGIAPKYQRALIMHGEGSNGKGVIAAVVAACMPPGSTCSIPPQLLGNEYYRAELAGCRLNVVNELPETDIFDSEPCKAIIAGDPIPARRIRQEPFELHPQAAHLFSANNLPGTKDQSHGFWRRWIVLSFNRIFTDEEKDPNLADYIIEHEKAEVVSWMIEGAVRLLSSNGYTLPASNDAAIDTWRLNADQVAEFLQECTVPAQSEDEGTSPAHMYTAYSRWTVRAGHKALGKRKMSNRMAALGVERGRVGGRRFYWLKLVDQAADRAMNQHQSTW